MDAKSCRVCGKSELTVVYDAEDNGHKLTCRRCYNAGQSLWGAACKYCAGHIQFVYSGNWNLGYVLACGECYRLPEPHLEVAETQPIEPKLWNGGDENV